jgi:ribonuclease HI
MELMAAVEALRRVPPTARVQIITDSTYLIDGATQWLQGWKSRNWHTLDQKPVQHQDLWQALEQLVGQRVQWSHVRGHTGDPENERVNALAQAFADNRSVPLPDTTRPTGTPPDGRPRYLSLVASRLMRHATWEECRARVHGISATKYKKCSSYAEELATIQGWGLSAADLAALSQ